MLIIDCKNKRIESVLKTYRQKVERCGQIDELKKRKEFEKPSVKQRKEKQRAKYRSKNENTELR